MWYDHIALLIQCWPKSLSFSITYGIQLSPIHMNAHFKFRTLKGANVCSIRCEFYQEGKSQLALCLLLLMTLQLHRLPPPLPPPSGTLLACSLHASPCVPSVVLYYCTFQGTVLQDEEYFLCLCIIYVNSIINRL